MTVGNHIQELGEVLESRISHAVSPTLCGLLGEPVECSGRKTVKITAANIDSLLPLYEKDRLMSAAYVKCDGDMNFGVMWCLPAREVASLSERLLGGLVDSVTEKITGSAISEVGNMLTSSVVNTLCAGNGSRVRPSVPGFATEHMLVLLESVVSDFGEILDPIAVTSMEFRGSCSGVNLELILFLDPLDVAALVP